MLSYLIEAIEFVTLVRNASFRRWYLQRGALIECIGAIREAPVGLRELAVRVWHCCRLLLASHITAIV